MILIVKNSHILGRTKLSNKSTLKKSGASYKQVTIFRDNPS